MSAAIRLSKGTIVSAANKHNATVIFFHGSGDTGENVRQWVDLLNKRELNFPHIKLMYPTAPSQPYTPNGGEISTVWFDRKAININVPEVRESIDSICKLASELIDQEVANGIPYNRIVVGGFSMGGALALHLAYRFKTSLAGCFAMSSFLNKNSLVYEALKNNNSTSAPPLIQFHGLRDELVPPAWGTETYKTLTDLDVKAEFVTLPNAFHELTRTEIQRLKEWILNVLPEKE
ncbi:lysophospholipase-like protein 1 [Cephus cinctus]|uniref:palmitoyl-protein hydrolase n=1 Tax=Cephus cinctus TaxID=211228 RepID=A0AAJ7BT05_CEPCN|nr:lysophospholipase-like protein 1 [Cephus cinctus]